MRNRKSRRKEMSGSNPQKAGGQASSDERALTRGCVSYPLRVEERMSGWVSA